MEEFLKALSGLKSDGDLTDFCRKRVLHGCPFVFNGREDEFYEFRKVIAHQFRVKFFEVYVIGSAKLGFSPFKGTPFSLDSDVDVAIVSELLFSEISERIYSYQLELRKGRRSVSERELSQYHVFLEYTALGWIRPDKFPTSFAIKELKDDWFGFFRSISYGKSNIGNYKVAAGVFKSYDYLERYVLEGYKQLKKELEVGQINANQIKPSVTNPTIASIYQDIASGALILRPEFQRKFVWTTEHQEEFIDTILHGYPFPEIYICTGEVNVDTLKTTHEVIDGQQRLTTIKNYIEGVSHRPFVRVRQYAELTEAEKRVFLTYQIVVRDIGQVDNEAVREIFRRINLTKFKLEDIEIHNAVYDGFFIQTAKRILDAIELEKYGVFKESEFTRMAELTFRASCDVNYRERRLFRARQRSGKSSLYV